MRIKKTILIALIFFTGISIAQVNVNVNIKRPIPSKVSTWEQDPTIVQLILQNTSQQSYSDAYFIVEVKDESGSVVGKTKVNNSALPTFTIPAGPPIGSGVLTLSGHDIVDMNAFDIDASIENSITTTNQLPEGYYDFCFTLLNSDGTPIGMPETNCVPIEILHPEPPALISPVNETVTAEFPQFIWAPVVGASPAQFIKYRITIVPRFDGQNVRTAVGANPPLIENFVQSTTYQYTPSDLPFDTYSGAVDYVWQVQALDADNEPIGSNEGKSEIAFFTLEEQPSDTSGGITPPVILPEIPIGTTLPTSTIKGKLRWVFDEQSSTESGDGSGSSGGTIFDSPSDYGNFFDPNSDGSSGGGFGLFGGGTNGSVTYGESGFPNFDLSNAANYPVANTTVKVYAATNKLLINNKLIGTAETDENGNFEVSFVDVGSEGSPAISSNGQTINFSKVKITIDNPYVELQNKTASLQFEKKNKYSVETKIGLANTFEFKPKVVEKDSHNEITNAVVKLGRFQQFYDNNPTTIYEGAYTPNREVIGSLFGADIVLVDTAYSGEPINNLFETQSGLVVNSFYIYVSAPGFDTYTTFMALNSSSSNSLIPTVEKTYELEASNPRLEGRVVRKDNSAVMPGLTVSLNKNGNVKYSTTTDNEGSFSIGDIAVSETAYTLKVEGEKISTYTEELMINQKGKVIKRDPLEVDAILVTIAGKIIDETGIGIPNANLRWESGGNSFFTDTEGRFVTANVAGEDSLYIRKIGYFDKDTLISIQVSEGSSYGYLDDQGFLSDWQNQLDNLSSLQGNTDFDFSNMGYLGNEGGSSNLFGDFYSGSGGGSEGESDFGFGSSLFSAGIFSFNNFGSNPVSNSSMDLGEIKLDKAVGKLLVTVEDSDDNSPISNAKVLIGSQTKTTDNSGQVYFDEAPSGNVTFRVESPEGQSYVPKDVSLNIERSKDTTKTTVQLEMGASVVGVVSVGGNGVDSARIRVEGREDIQTFTDNQGNYQLNGVPLGQWTLKASKTGYIGESKQSNFQTGQNTLNFSLTDAGFNISKLLGFDIEVDKLNTQGADTTITGAFVNIPSNVVWKASEDLRLPFTDVKVTNYQNKLRADGDSVVTDKSEVTARLFDFLVIKGKDNGGIVVKSMDSDPFSGEIRETPVVDFKETFSDVISSQWVWNLANDPILKLPQQYNPSSDGKITLFNSSGQFPFLIDSLTFATVGQSGEAELDIYGFPIELDFSKSSIKQDGLHLRGNISTDALPHFENVSLEISHLWIDTEGKIKETKFDFDANPEISLADWKLTLQNALLDETGFSFAGVLEFSLPASQQSTIDFSKLKVTKDQIFGGEFTLPDQGIDIFDILAFKTSAGQSISFGKEGNSSVFYIKGAGHLEINKIIQDTLSFKNFIVKSNGEFAATIATNYKTSIFGIADIEVNSVGFSYQGTPKVDVDGSIRLNGIPFVNAEAGNITYFGDGSVSVDKIGLGFDIVGVAEVNAEIEIVNKPNKKGFAGDGSIAIANTSVEAGIGFHYYKVQGGVDFGANFSAGVTIPVGTLVISEIGGGFQYNTATNEYLVEIQGRVVVAPGTESVVKLDPLSVTVENGPVIQGSAKLYALNQNIANSQVVIDFPNKKFSIENKFQIEFLEDLNMSINANQILVISGKPGDKYWFLGLTAHATLIEIINANANLAVGWGLNRSAHSEYNQYTNFIDSQYLTNGNTLNGVYLRAKVEYGIKENEANWHTVINLKIAKAQVKGWYYQDTYGELNLNFVTQQLAIELGAGWGAGGKFKVSGLGTIAGIDIGANGTLAGSFSPSQGWFINGSVSAWAKAHIGSCGGGCATRICTKWKVIPVGGQICIHPSLEVTYHSRGSNKGADIDINW